MKAAFAFLVAVIGIYSMVSYGVSQRKSRRYGIGPPRDPATMALVAGFLLGSAAIAAAVPASRAGRSDSLAALKEE